MTTTCFGGPPRKADPRHVADTAHHNIDYRSHSIGYCGNLTVFATGKPRNVTCPDCITLMRHRAELIDTMHAVFSKGGD